MLGSMTLLDLNMYLPMYENMSSPEPGCVDEVVELGDILEQVLAWGVCGLNDQVFLVLRKKIKIDLLLSFFTFKPEITSVLRASETVLCLMYL